MNNFEEKLRIYKLPFEDVINDLEEELKKVLQNEIELKSLLKENNYILNSEFYRPVLERIHKKWIKEFENERTLIEEIVLVYNSKNNDYRWEPTRNNIQKYDKEIFYHNFTLSQNY